MQPSHPVLQPSTPTRARSDPFPQHTRSRQWLRFRRLRASAGRQRGRWLVDHTVQRRCDLHKGRVALVLFGLALSRLALQREGGVGSTARERLTLRAPEGGPASPPSDEVNHTPRDCSQQQATTHDTASGHSDVLRGEHVAAVVIIDDFLIIWRKCCGAGRWGKRWWHCRWMRRGPLVGR